MKLRGNAVRMKALTTFRGKEGLVRRGTEFDALGHGRADSLERNGCAVKVTPQPVHIAERDAQGGVSFKDPFAQAGGAIGQAPPQSPSPPVPAPKKRHSRKRAANAKSSASTSRGSSLHGPTSFTEQTDHGGSTAQGSLDLKE